MNFAKSKLNFKVNPHQNFPSKLSTNNRYQFAKQTHIRNRNMQNSDHNSQKLKQTHIKIGLKNHKTNHQKKLKKKIEPDPAENQPK